MFTQNWKLALISIIMIPLQVFLQELWVKDWKSYNRGSGKSGFLNTYLVELFKTIN